MAAVGLAFAGPVFAQPAGNDPGRQPGTQQAEQKPQPDNTPLILETIERAVERVTRAIESVKDDPDAKKKEQREDSDLEAQWEMARWAENMFWAALGSLVLTFAGIVLIAATLLHTKRAADYAGQMVVEAKATTAAAIEAAKEAKRQADLAETSLNVSMRPWVTFDSYNLTAAGEPQNVEAYQFEFRWTVSGQTPAIGLRGATGRLDDPRIDFERLSIQSGNVGPGRPFGSPKINFTPEEIVASVDNPLLCRSVLRYETVFGSKIGTCTTDITLEVRYVGRAPIEAVRRGQINSGNFQVQLRGAGIMT